MGNMKDVPTGPIGQSIRRREDQRFLTGTSADAAPRQCVAERGKAFLIAYNSDLSPELARQCRQFNGTAVRDQCDNLPIARITTDEIKGRCTDGTRRSKNRDRPHQAATKDEECDSSPPKIMATGNNPSTRSNTPP